MYYSLHRTPSWENICSICIHICLNSRPLNIITCRKSGSLSLYIFIFLKIVFILYFLNFLFCIGVYLINNVVIVPGGQQRDSAIHIHASILSKTPSHPGYHITQSRVPCAVQQVIVGYAFYFIFLVMHFKYSSVYMSIQNSLSLLSTLPPWQP